MTLKKFLKYFDTMCEIRVMEFPNPEERGIVLFEGHVFDNGAKKKLKKLYDAGYKLDRNEDGEAVIMFHYTNKYGVIIELAQINVKKGGK